MCSVSVLCPLCAQSSFASIDALRVSLIRAANGPLPCPICHELFLGLDKLTIHLFSHTDIFAIATQSTIAHSNSSVAVENDEKSQIFVPSPRDINAPTLQSDPVRSKETQELASKKTQQCNSGDNRLVDEAIARVKLESWQNLPTCDICEFNFRNTELLELHVRLVHQNDVVSLADTSQPLNAGVDLSSGHKKVHEFKCHLCAKTFKMKGSLRVHLKVVHLIGQPVGNNATKPSICDRIRTHKEEVATHQNASTSQINATKLPLFAEDSSQTPSILTLQRKFNSNQCTITTNSSSNMLIMPDHTTQELPSTVVVALSNGSSAEPPELESDMDKDNGAKANTENAKIWECGVCSKAFTTKYFLKKHKRLHTGEMPYTCEICARTFTFQQSYHKHLLYHSDEKPHICVTCGRAFKELSTLHNHERIHSGEKPFKCDVCDKSFRQRVSFLVHTRIHTGVMPYKCDVCQKSFRYKVSQRTHKCLPNTGREAGALTGDNNTQTSEQISECFIKAFLESASASAMHESQNSPNSAEIAAINAMDINDGHLDVKHVMDEAMLSKTIDDIVVESCNKMGIGNMDPVLNLTSTSNGLCGGSVACATDGHNSPSFKFQNMRLYSPVMLQQQVAAVINAANDETSDFSHFLLDDARNDIL